MLPSLPFSDTHAGVLISMCPLCCCPLLPGPRLQPGSTLMSHRSSPNTALLLDADILMHEGLLEIVCSSPPPRKQQQRNMVPESQSHPCGGSAPPTTQGFVMPRPGLWPLCHSASCHFPDWESSVILPCLPDEVWVSLCSMETLSMTHFQHAVHII